MTIKELKEKIKKLDYNLSLPERELKKFIPENYFKKNIFRVAVGIIFILTIFGAYTLDFDFKNYYTVSCTQPQPCLNPFYFCLHQDELNILDNCDGLDMNEICKQGVCETKYIQPYQTLGKQKPDISWLYWVSIGILLTAFLINHTVWYWRKEKC